MRRLSRIYPALLAFVLIAALLFIGTPLHVGPLAILSALSFTINYMMIYFHHTGLFDHLWSLCVEEHSYILLGALAWLHRRSGFNVPAVLFAVGILAVLNGVFQYQYLGFSYFDVFWRTDVQLAPIFIAAAFYLLIETHPALRLGWLCPAFLIIAVVCKTEFAPIAISYSVGTIALAAAVASLQDAAEFVRKGLSAAWLRQLGVWSYSLYLWQQPFYKLIGIWPTQWLFSAAIALGLLSFYFIESPARRELNRRIGRFKRGRLASSLPGEAGS